MSLPAMGNFIIRKKINAPTKLPWVTLNCNVPLQSNHQSSRNFKKINNL